MRVNQVRTYDGLWFSSVTTDVIAEDDFDETLVKLLDAACRDLLTKYTSAEFAYVMVSPAMPAASLSFEVLDSLDAKGVRVVMVFRHGDQRKELRSA